MTVMASPHSITEDPRWAALRARDAAQDGRFVYAVRTTGVYCRPSCGAEAGAARERRLLRPWRGGAGGGFRACKRCRPDEPSREAQGVVAAPAGRSRRPRRRRRLDALADEVGLSPLHFHRLFKAATGLTPRAYAAAQRAKRVRDAPGAGDGSVTEAIYDAGFNRSGRFYESSNAMLGMTPTDFRARRRGGGASASPSASARSAPSWSRERARASAPSPRRRSRYAGARPAGPLSARRPRRRRCRLRVDRRGVVGLVEAPAVGLDLPLDIRGTAFQQRVWQALREIPAGTHRDLCRHRRGGSARPKAVRAVARACAANPIAVAIPCHRVVRTDGSLSGYRWGVERKRDLLAREAVGYERSSVKGTRRSSTRWKRRAG